MVDYYATLGVTKTATSEDIKKAWRKAARLLHPDASGSDASSQVFRKAREAYEILGDPAKRAIYDQTLERELKDQSSGHEEGARKRNLPWKREDALVFKNIVLKGSMILFNSNTLIEYLVTIPQPLAKRVLDRVGELLSAGILRGQPFTNDSILIHVDPVWYEAAKINHKWMPWVEDCWKQTEQTKENCKEPKASKKTSISQPTKSLNDGRFDGGDYLGILLFLSFGSPLTFFGCQTMLGRWTNPFFRLHVTLSHMLGLGTLLLGLFTLAVGVFYVLFRLGLFDEPNAKSA